MPRYDRGCLWRLATDGERGPDRIGPRRLVAPVERGGEPDLLAGGGANAVATPAHLARGLRLPVRVQQVLNSLGRQLAGQPADLREAGTVDLAHPARPELLELPPDP